MSSHFPFGIVIWIIIWLIKDLNKKENQKVSAPTAQEPRKLHFAQCYYSNFQIVSDTHLFYYCDMLGISGKQDITDLTIEESCYYKINSIEVGGYDEVLEEETNKYEAARAYLLDRWSYMSHLN